MQISYYFDTSDLYHGTYHRFDRFAPLSHFGTRLAAQDRLLTQHPSQNPDTTFSFHQRVLYDHQKEIHHQILQEQKEPLFIRQQKYKSYLIPVHLNISNPLWIVDAEYMLQDYKGYVLNFLGKQYDDYTKMINYMFRTYDNTEVITNKLKNIFNIAKDQFPDIKIYQFIFHDPETLPIEAVKTELSLETLFTPEQTNQAPDDVNRTRLIKQRMIRLFEQNGYDGLAYINRNEDIGSTSYVIFRPEQVVRADRNNTAPFSKSPSPENEEKLTAIFNTYLSTNQASALTDDEIHTLIKIIFMDDPLHTADTTWIHFALNTVLPKIETLYKNRPELPERLARKEKCILLGIELALMMEADPLPVTLACALYDERANDNSLYVIPNIQTAQFFLDRHDFNLSQPQKEQILQAIETCAKQKDPTNLVSACLWDANQICQKWFENRQNIQTKTPLGTHFSEVSPQQDIRLQKKYLNSLYLCSYMLGDFNCLLCRHPQSVPTVRPSDSILHTRA